ncbi:MAG: hypothetical protein AAFU80_03435 [Pseudomonadota bacterium]
MRYPFLISPAIFVWLVACSPQISTAPIDLARFGSAQNLTPTSVAPARVLSYFDSGAALFQLSDATGIQCVARSDLYEVPFTTPAILNIPTFEEASSDTVVTCRYRDQTETRTATCFILRDGNTCDYADLSFIFRQ